LQLGYILSFFFSSRRRHTRFSRDWSSDVCSSDLVADIVLDMHLDVISIVTALLHDVVEDTTVDLQTVREKFGETCAMLVDGLTKIGRASCRERGWKAWGAV